MAHRELIKLMESNILTLDRMSDRLKRAPRESLGYPRQQIAILVRLYLGGQAKLKDIAMREMSTVSNLCAAFRKLEKGGLVARMVDDSDRRNTYYSVTSAGEKIAQQAMEVFHRGIGGLFENIARADEIALISALKTMNSILKKMELNNA